MIDQRRHQYLDAMGVQVWERRASEVLVQESSQQESSTPAQTPVQDESVPVLAESVLPVSVPSDPAPEDQVPEDQVPKNQVQQNNDREEKVATMGWPELQQTVMQCTRCQLHQGRTQAVFGIGDQQADWMIIGEAPGADEDVQGEPFVGRAGILLTSMLQAVGLKREQVYIGNIVKCRPPANRDPVPAEAATCRAYLERQIALVKPRLILAVGRIAAHNLLATDVAVGKLRGKVHTFGKQQTPLVVTYHPAYLLRSPAQKAKAWEDLQLACTVLEQGNA